MCHVNYLIWITDHLTWIPSYVCQLIVMPPIIQTFSLQ